MAFAFVRFGPEHAGAVERFNARMRGGGVEDLFLIGPQPGQAPEAGAPVSWERILALDGEGEVRGSYLAQWRDYHVRGRTLRLGNYQTPVSEGIVDKRHTAVGLLMARHALAANPHWYTVGMGGLERPLPRMLKSLGWHLSPVPFRFRILRPYRFLREIRHLRTAPARRAALDTLAFSGAGWLGVRAFELARSLGSGPGPAVAARAVDRFGDWADALWEKARDGFPLAAVRTADHLNALYPPPDARYLRFRFDSGARLLGWAVVLRQPLRDNKYFGSMTAGVLADCLAAPADLAAVARAAGAELRGADVDIGLANPLHAACLEGLAGAGFLAGPTNYGFGISKALAALLDPAGETLPSMHLMRGDGDGLSNFGANH